jgi:class 3 adenylate cyclase
VTPTRSCAIPPQAAADGITRIVGFRADARYGARLADASIIEADPQAVTSSGHPHVIQTVERGRDAVSRHEWAEAIEALVAVDRDEGLAPDDLVLLGTSLWWAGQPDGATEALERAFAGFTDAGRHIDAAGVAFRLCYEAFRSLNVAVAGGWLAQAERLLADEPESAIHAWPLVFHSLDAVMATRIDEGIEIAGQAIEVARRTGNADALYQAMSFSGIAHVAKGDVQAGLALIDEAAAAASTGRLGLRTASDIYCNTISCCRSVGDLGRAAQWADEGERWMRRQSVGGYPGICRIHRAEIKMLRGEWAAAEQEARQASEELVRYRLLDAVGFAYYQVGEVRLRMGDLDAAAEAFDRAYEYGHDAQPGLALLQLARGEVADARRSLDRVLVTAAGTGGVADRTTRARLLPAKVDIDLAAHDLDAARAAVEEMESIATDFAQPLFRAGAMTARGELLLGQDRASEASPVLGQSWRLWQSTNLPYESARARLHYAEALAAEGDATTARRDLVAARTVFERLGATLDLERVDALLGAGGGEPATSTGGGPRVTRTFMFTDIVTSTDLVGAMGDEAWTELLRWHDRELRSAFAQHSGEEVAHTGDGFFVAFERARDGIECAVDIQRRLARHRREHGFAVGVRIGLHAASATRERRNYIGGGVHVAARVGAAAAKEEILVTRSVVDGAGPMRFALTDPRPLTLKGVREPVEVQAVEWR